MGRCRGAKVRSAPAPLPSARGGRRRRSSPWRRLPSSRSIPATTKSCVRPPVPRDTGARPRRGKANPMPTIQSQLDAAFRSAIRAVYDLDADPLVGVAQNEKFGDYQANAAMGLAKLVNEMTGQKT